MIGIYKITNPKNKIYIGQSIDIKKRFAQYKNMHCKTQKMLYNSFQKYGVDNHKFEVIIECDNKELNDLEKYYQEIYNCVYNGLNCFIVGSETEKRIYSEQTLKNLSEGKIKAKRIISDEERQKRSERMKGEKNPMFGRIKELNPFYGRKHSDYTKQLISNSNKGEKHCFYGKKRPEQGLKIKGEKHVNFGKKDERTNLMNKQRVGLKNPVAKIYLDLNTGVYYYSASDYCKINKIDECTFRYRYKNNKFNQLVIV